MKDFGGDVKRKWYQCNKCNRNCIIGIDGCRNFTQRCIDKFCEDFGCESEFEGIPNREVKSKICQ